MITLQSILKLSLLLPGVVSLVSRAHYSLNTRQAKNGCTLTVCSPGPVNPIIISNRAKRVFFRPAFDPNAGGKH